jgi:hypothetical protein
MPDGFDSRISPSHTGLCIRYDAASLIRSRPGFNSQQSYEVHAGSTRVDGYLTFNQDCTGSNPVAGTMWQDYTIGIVVFLFALSIIPLIRHRTVVPLTTGVLMTAGAAVLAVTYITLQLWFSVTVEAFSVVMWGLVLINSMHGSSSQV